MKLKILDLFSGLGGFSLGLERTGRFKTVAFCDNDKFSTLVLQKHWKGVKVYNDVKEIKKERLEADGIPSPDVITGGFPCQPFSVAGKQKGTSDDRHLWPEMFRIIQEFTPRWIIAENVKGLTNIQDGMVFETVCTDLEGEGYEVRTFNIPAAGVGAPHRRERIWIVAHSSKFGCGSRSDNWEGRQVSNNEARQLTQDQSEQQRWESGSRKESNTRSITESRTNQGNEFKWQDLSRSKDVENSNDNGLEGRLTETRNQVSAGKEPTIHGSTNTNISSRRSHGRGDNEQPRIDGEVQGLRDGNEKKSPRATGIRGLHERTNISQGVAREDRNQEDDSRTLVQEGQSRIQSSIDRGLEQDQTSSEDNQVRQCDDNTSLNRMETGRDEDVEDSRRTLRPGTELRETNEDEIRKEDAHQHQRSSRPSESDVADSDRMQRLLLRGQKSESGQETFERSRIGSSTPRENVANTHSGRSDEPDNKIQARWDFSLPSSEDVADTEGERLQRSRRQESSRNFYGLEQDTQGNKNEIRSESERRSRTSTDVADTESSIGYDHEAVAGDGESSTQEVFGDGSSVSGESSWWDFEPDVGRVAHGIPGRVYRLKGLGNSIVPKIAEEIGKAIITAEIEEKKKGCPHN